VIIALSQLFDVHGLELAVSLNRLLQTAGNSSFTNCHYLPDFS